MPELPEVETIVRDLRSELKGKRIRDFSCDRPKQLNFPVAQFKKKIVGLSIKSVRRRAKIIIIDLTKDLSLLIHLKMTGQLILRGKSGCYSGGGHPIPHYLKELPNKFTHAVFTFSDGQQLFFNDVRIFGYIKLIPTAEIDDLFQKKKLGPEPLSSAFTPVRFQEMIMRRKISKIKPLLMDQSFIAGIGNIYADETLHYAGISPTRIATFIKPAELKKLHEGIKKILNEAIKHRGTSADTYVDGQGAQGSYEAQLKVYGRRNKKCLTCQTPLKIMKLGGRTTIWCPHCQP